MAMDIISGIVVVTSVLIPGVAPTGIYAVRASDGDSSRPLAKIASISSKEVPPAGLRVLYEISHKRNGGRPLSALGRGGAQTSLQPSAHYRLALLARPLSAIIRSGVD